jgi:short-chain fatty acids transporter
VLAVVLSLAAIFVAWWFPQSGELRDLQSFPRFAAVLTGWLGAVWNTGLLAFALQMCTVLLTGFGLARAPVALRALRRLASVARTNRGGVMLVAAVSCAGCWINWGFGLVLAGLLAGEVRRHLAHCRQGCEYALIVAAAYTGMMVWHGGLSGSAPLKVASEGIALPAGLSPGEDARVLPPIPLRQTTLSTANLAFSALLLVGVPLVMGAMATRTVPHPDGAQECGQETAGDAVATAEDTLPGSLADRLNSARWVPAVLGTVVIIALALQLRERGAAAIELNFVNSVFLAAGLLLHRNLMAYLAAILEGGRAVVGIVLQFPLYAGIQGVMVHAGLAAAISTGFVRAAESVSVTTHLPIHVVFPIATLLSAGVVNFFVPSGGAQWIVQGPIMCAAAVALGVSTSATVMSIAYGDQWTNMVQPFWAIPLMGMTKVDPRQFLGYCAAVMLLAGPVFMIAVTFL